MGYLIKNASVFCSGAFISSDILVDNGRIISVAPSISPVGNTVADFKGCFVFPGFVDVHVHLREPGFCYKETVKTGTLAAAHGGYTSVCSMPNLNPVPDSTASLLPSLEAIERDAVINVYPYGAITKCEAGGELSDMEDIAANVIAFSDDGKGVQNGEMMKEAMLRTKALGKIISAHCEDNSLLFGGYIHKGAYAEKHNHRGICSESEWGPIARDLKLAEQTGAAYHVCHISTKESVRLIREAKARGVDVTCETAPHYLTLCEDDLKEDGRFKMNPPLRSREDKEALIEGLLDGTIDMIATDHAPHSAEEKSKGLEKSAMGITGLECAFPVLYTRLVKPGIIPLERIVELMTAAPGKRFGIGGEIKPGSAADLTVFDFSGEFVIHGEDFLSKGKCTPFEGEKVFGKCLLTLCGGREVYKSV